MGLSNLDYVVCGVGVRVSLDVASRPSSCANHKGKHFREDKLRKGQAGPNSKTG